jgi:hypothetical protein
LRQVRFYNLSQSKDWSFDLKKIPNSKKDVYYTPEYYQLYENRGDGDAFCFVYEEGENIALYPFLRNPLPYGFDGFDIQGAYGYNGVLANNSSPEFKKAFYQSFNQYCKDTNIVAEFTRFNPITDNRIFSEGYLAILYDRDTVLLNLEQSSESVWENDFSSNNRNMIRKAIKSNIIITKLRTKKAFQHFYELYQATMADINASDFYFFSESYFLDIYNYIKEAHIYEAKLNDETIGSILVFEYGNFSHYHLSARNRNYAKYASNNYLLFEAIKNAIHNNSSIFHFGGGSGGDSDHLLKFKANFSKAKKQFYIGKKIHNLDVYKQLITTWEKENNITEKYDYNKLLRYRDKLIK